MERGAYGGPPCFLLPSPYKNADKSIIFWSNSFIAGQYSLFPLFINVVISLLVAASDITPLPDPEKHPNGWCLAVIRIWGKGGASRHTEASGAKGRGHIERGHMDRKR
jgi:hypothetical protein